MKTLIVSGKRNSRTYEVAVEFKRGVVAKRKVPREVPQEVVPTPPRFGVFGERSGVPHSREQIDEADTRAEANRLRHEYALAFGLSWIITVEAVKGEES